jgi:prepilin signal peptidase PulO-like enzyme (type II secretory pathway)
LNAILAIPLPVRLSALFLIGVLAGSVVNWLADVLAWSERSVSPWTKRRGGRRQRRAVDYVPVVGWLSLRREEPLDGRGFWIRPLMVELLSGLALAALYWWETQQSVRMPPLPFAVPPSADFLTTNLALADHVRFVAHALLVLLMLAASLIDLDEQTIPDTITVGGAIAALVLAAVYPWSLLPAAHWVQNAQVSLEFLTLASPNPWPAGMQLPAWTGAALAIGCWTLWCGGLLPRYWNNRRGWKVAAVIFYRRLIRYRVTQAILAMWLAGVAGIEWTARWAGPASWAALVTSLLGLAVGGGIIWAVRTIGGRVLKREAMGFGDVTLMSMIGAFLGWQACLIIFFVAPFFGLVFAVMSWVAHRERAIPYGPFLCLGTLLVMLKWPACWDRVVDFFALWWLVPALITGCLVMLGVLLWMFRLLGQAVSRPR